MKPVLFAIIGVFGYVVMNVMIEQRLKHASPLANSLLLLVTGIAFVLPAAVLQWYYYPKFVLPPLTDWRLLVGLGVSFLLADYFFLKAYNSGGSLMMISTMVAMFPVFASLLNAGLGGNLPPSRQWLGWLVALITIVLVSEQPTAPNSSNSNSATIESIDHTTAP